MTMTAEAVVGAMDVLAGKAPRTGRSVRGVAQWSHNQQCPTNNAMFASRIDGDGCSRGRSKHLSSGRARSHWPAAPE
jgi:hypothetical protein